MLNTNDNTQIQNIEPQENRNKQKQNALKEQVHDDSSQLHPNIIETISDNMCGLTQKTKNYL